MIEIVCASNNDAVLHANLLRSPITERYPIVVRKGYTNISKAYNSVASYQTFSCYVHHDVFLHADFEKDLLKAIDNVTGIDKNWGVLGVAGVQLINSKRHFHGYISDRGKEWGSRYNLPHEVDTLDELLLITRGDFRFDENLDLDYYGADICMQAKERGRKCYAINAYCEHNSSRPMGGRTESFYRCQKYFKTKWQKFLPTATTCGVIEL